jgi:hypothetical protein
MTKTIKASLEPLPDLKARFEVRRGLFRKEKVEAAVYYLDEHACIFKTDKIFKPGDTLSLDLIMAMPFDNLEASAMTGLVTKRKKHCSNFFYSVDFIGSGGRFASAAQNKLERICDVLNKKQSLRLRRSGAASSLVQIA